MSDTREPIKCRVCRMTGDVRVSQEEGAFGTCMLPFCERCYAIDAKERRAEAKRFGYRTYVKPWVKLIPAAQAAWVDV